MPAVRGKNPGPDPPRYLPQVALATLAVVGLPLAVVTAIQLEGGLRSPWLSMVVAVGLSVAISSAGLAIWKRRPGSRDIVFGDLMLWGFIRRRRADRRIASATYLLNDTEGGAGLDAEERMEGLHLLGSSLESRDAYTHGHTRRVTRYTEAIARRMGLSQEQVARVRTAAALHDVGKVLTPRAILTKPGELTAEEFESVKSHAADGAQMVATLDDDDLTATVRHHHERLDGSGYPDGLEGTAIPLGARIVAVADTFDAMTSSRPYRRARSHKAALDTLSREGGSTLDADVVAAFLAYYSGRRTVAWGTAGIAAPQRLLAWVLDVGAAPVAKGITAAGAAALIGSSLAIPELPPAGAASDRAASASPGVTGGSAAAPGDRSPGGDAPAAGRRISGGGGSRTQGPGAQSPAGASPGDPASRPDGGGNVPQGGGTPGGGPSPANAAPGGGGSGGGGTTVPTEVSVPGTQTPGGGVELNAPGVDANVQLPQVQLPGVRIEVPAVQLPGGKVELPLSGPR